MSQLDRIEHEITYLLNDQRKCRICEGIAESMPTDCPRDKISASMARDIRGGRMDFVDGRWTSVTPMQQIIDGRADGIQHPPVGSRWAHDNGNQYTVLMMANVNTTKPIKFPVIVVYRNQHGHVHTRKLAYWYESMMNDLSPCRDDPHLVNQDGLAIVHHFLANDEPTATVGPEHVCKYCGMPSHVDPSDQVAPADYCHPVDHGSAEDAGEVFVSADEAAAAMVRLEQWRQGSHDDADYRAANRQFAEDVLSLMSDRRQVNRNAQRAWLDEQTRAALTASLKALLTPAGPLKIKNAEEAIEQINKVIGPV